MHSAAADPPEPATAEDFIPAMPPVFERFPTPLKHLAAMRRDMLHGLPRAAFAQQAQSLKLLRRLILVINDPELIRDVFIGRAAIYQAKSRSMEQLLAPMMGGAMFIGHGPVWAARRALMAQLLHPSNLPGFHAPLLRAAEELRALWDMADPLAPRDIADDLAAATTRIMLRLVLGPDAPVDGAAEVARALDAYQDHARHFDLLWLFGLPAPLTGWQTRAARRLGARIQALAGAAIAGAGEGRGGLLPALRAARGADGAPLLDAAALRDEVSMLLLAGSETAAVTLTWASYMLANHQPSLARLRAELDGVLAGRLPSAEDLAALPYTRAVVNETFRLYPPVAILSRRALAADRIRRWAVPEGSMVLASPWLTHRNPLLWDAPNAFRPERFLPEAVRQIPKHAFMPFGIGPRICAGAALGMAETMVLLASIMARFELSLPAGARITPRCRLTLRPAGGMPMLIARRRAA